ncbi:MAG: DUF5011 domain-containing protein [Nitrosopumilus sp.]|nr:DUF5011 domain-containing protein [Nitrosopumilus sp.]
MLVAQILGASGLPQHNGIAPGVSFINLPVGATATSLSTYIHAIDRLVGEGVDVINMSFGRPENCAPTTVFLVLNEAAGRGVVMVSSAGNEGKVSAAVNAAPKYNSISNPGCMRSVITVGGIDDQDPSDIRHNPGSSRGPGKDPSGANNILKPEIVAPAVIYGLIGERDSRNLNYRATGTSFASPLVAGTAAILLQADPSLTPVEVRGALLLGARWTGPDQCNSAGYEAVDPDSGCSHAMQVTSRTLPNAESMRVLNNMGLGILDASASVRYVLGDGHVVAGQIGDSSDTRTYTFTVSEAGEQVKLIMTWLVDSQNPSQNRLNTERIYGTPNLDFVTTDPGGDRLDLASGTSAWQNTEFAVFDAPEAGTYTVTVGGSGLEDANQRGLGFSLASTHPLGRAPGPDGLPEGEGRTAVFEPGRATKILLEADDPDGDPVSFRVSKDPRSGTLSGVAASGDASYVVYTQAGSTPDRFSAVPYDGTGEGGQFTVRLVPESLPDGARSDGARMARTNGTDVLEIPDGSGGPLSVLFPGRDYPVKYVQLHAANMIEPVVEIRTADGAYTVSVPDGYRRIILEDPTMISSVAISAGGIDAGFAQRAPGGPPGGTAHGTHVSVGYLGAAPEGDGAPKTSLLGPDPHHVAVSSGTYGDVDPGAACADDAGSASYTSNSSSVPLDVQKRFTVAYTCADETGYSSSATRVVIVDDKVPGRPVVESGGRIGAGAQLPDATCADVRGERTMLAVTLRDINGRDVPGASTEAPGSYVATYECRNADGTAGTPVSRDITVGFDGGAPLYMDIAGPVRNTCGGEPLPPGEAAYGTAGLSVSLPYDSADRVSYIEVQAGSTGRSLAIYNFTVDGDRLTAIVPPGALGFITGGIPGETFYAYAIESSIFIDRHQLSITSGNQLASLDGKLFRYMGHPGVSHTQYSKFDHISEYTALKSGRLYEFDGSKLVQQSAVISNPEVLVVTCHTQTEARTTVDGPDPPPSTADISGGSPPAITGGPPGGIIHFRAGAAVPWHGMSCTDGGVDVAITPPPGVGVYDIRNGTVDVRYSCTDGSATDTETITYLVDGTPPVVTPPGGSVDIELGDESEPAAGSCRDPYPDPAAYDGINEPSLTRSGHGEDDVRAALDARSPGTFVTIFECEDAAGNVARSTLTRNVVDTRAPNPPTISNPEVTSTAPEPIDYGDVSCDPEDAGTPLRLENTTTRDGLPYNGAIDPSVPGTYVVSYMCADASQSSSPATQTVSVEPGSVEDDPPEITGGPADGEIHFKRGDPVPAHGLTCRAGDLDLTSTIAPNATVDKDVQRIVPVKYTCAHGGESVERTIKYVVDGTAPKLVARFVHGGHLEAPRSIHYDLHAQYVAHNMVGCLDEFPPAKLDHKVVTRGKEVLDEAFRTKTEITRDVVVTYDCRDRAGNDGVQGHGLFQMHDKKPPGDPAVPTLKINSTVGDDVDLGGASCMQDEGSRVDLRSSTWRSGAEIPRPASAAPEGPYVDTSIPAKYEVRYWCADARHRSDIVTQTVTIKQRPVLLSGQPAGPIRLKMGDPVPDHGITCTDLSTTPGAAPEILDGAVDRNSNGTQPVTYRCVDDDGLAQDARVTYIVDGTPPVVSAPRASVLELGARLGPADVACADPYPRGAGTVTSTGEDAVRAALASNKEHDAGITVTYTCTDAVGNEAAARTVFTVLDGTPPAEPDVRTRSVVVLAGRMIDYGASCKQDGGTPVTIKNTTYRGQAQIGGIDASEPGSYRVDYVCADSKHESGTVSQRVTVLGGGASDFSSPPATGVHVRNATHYDPGDVCGAQVAYSPALKGLEDGRHQVVASCGTDEAHVEIIVDNDPPVITLDGGSEHYVMPVAGGTYLDADPGYECTDDPPGIVDAHGSDAADHPISANGTFEVSYTCRDAAGNVRNETRDVGVDGGRPAPPAVDGTDPTYRTEVGTALAPPDIRCEQDGGSPVHPAARLAFYGPDGAPMPGIDGSTPIGSYRMGAWCEDAAGNRSGELDHFVVVVGPPAPVRSDGAVSLLEGRGDAYIQLVEYYRHTLVCRPDGINPDNSRLVFDPPLDGLQENHANRVTVYCPDTQNRVDDASTKTVTITLDDTEPVLSTLSRLMDRSVLYISDAHQQTTRNYVLGWLKCSDAVDADPVRSIQVTDNARVSIDEYREELTELVIADHRSRDDPDVGIFDLVELTCRDRAGNVGAFEWLLVEDKRISVFPGANKKISPVISIEQLVREVPQGSSYTYNEEDLRCGDYTPHKMTFGTADTRSYKVEKVSHYCTDGVGFWRPADTWLYVPHPDGPRITIHNADSVVKRGDPMPVSATCVDKAGNELPVTEDTYLKFYDSRFAIKFKQNKFFFYGLNEWPMHALFTCVDKSGWWAAASGAFTQVASKPQMALSGITKVDRQETLESAFRNAHIAGTTYEDPGAKCYYHFDDPPDRPIRATENVPDEDTRPGTLLRVGYVCTSDDGKETVKRHRNVAVLERKVIEFDSGSPVHEGGAPLRDDARCLGFAGPVETPAPVITGPDGAVDQIGILTPAGEYTLEYTCRDTPFSHEGLDARVIEKKFTRQLQVTDLPDTPIIQLDGADPATVKPGDVFMEPGYACIDRPDGGNVTASVTTNGTGYVMGFRDTVVRYDCEDGDGNPAEPAYRTLLADRTPQITVNEVLPVEKKSLGANLPTATCTLFGGGTVELAPVMRGSTSGTTEIGDHRVVIRPPYDDDANLPFDNPNRTHTITFRCTDGDVSSSESARFTQVNPDPLVKVDGFSRDYYGETRASQLKNLHVAGTPYPHDAARCLYYKEGVLAAGEPGFKIDGEVKDVPGVYKVKYTCSPESAGERSRSVTRVVSVVERSSPVITGAVDTRHEGGRFVDQAKCSGIFGDSDKRPNIPGPVLSTTIKRGENTVDKIEEAGTYKIDYTCTERYLGNTFTAQASRTVEIVPVTSPVIDLEGPNPLTIRPGQMLDEPGYSCTDRPGGENLASAVIHNGTGFVAGREDDVIEYTCSDGTEDAEPAYREIRIDRAPVIKIGTITHVEKKSGGAGLPTATCSLFGGGTVELAPVMSGARSGATEIGDHRVVIRPSYNDEASLPFDNPNRTHTITFRCTDGDVSSSESARFTQVNPDPLVKVDGFSRDYYGETRASQLKNLHVAGTPYPHDAARCLYYKEGVLAAGEPGFKIDGEVRDVPGVYRITYTCSPESAGDNSRSVKRIISVLERANPVITGAVDTDHELGSKFVDPVKCSGIFGDSGKRPNIPQPELSKTITRDEIEVDRIDEAGTYKIDYTCTERYLGMPFRADASRTVNVLPASSPVIKLKGPDPFVIKTGTAFDEPGYSCTDRPGGENLTSAVIHNGTGFVAGTEDDIIKYMCSDGAEDAEPAYRRIVVDRGLEVLISGTEYVSYRHNADRIALPTASCVRAGEVLGEIKPVTDESGNSHVTSQPGAGSATIEPPFVNRQARTFDDWRVEHEITFTCTDNGEEASDSATFYSIGRVPLIGIPGYAAENGVETAESRLGNLHIKGEKYSHDDVACRHMADDPVGVGPGSILTVTRDLPEGARLAVHPVSYSCDPARGPASVLERQVSVVLRLEPVLTGLANVTHSAGSAFEDAVGCSGIFGPAIGIRDLGDTKITRVITGPDGPVDGLGDDGSYRITYTCTQAYLGREISSEPASRNVTVIPVKSLVIKLDGDNPLVLRPGETFDEPGYSCTQSPGGLNLTSAVIHNGTGYVAGTDDDAIKYTCENTDGLAAEPAYREIRIDRAPVIQIGKITPVEKKSGGAGLPTATCTLYGGDTAELAPVMRGARSGTTEIGDHRVVIRPPYNDGSNLPFRAPNVTHTVTFTCTDGDLTATESAKFTQVNPTPLISVPKYSRDHLGETSASQLRNLHVAGTPYPHEEVKCRHYKIDDLLSAGDPGFKIEGMVKDVPGVYKVKYTCSPESAGDRSKSVTRTISVVERSSPEITGTPAGGYRGGGATDGVRCLGLFGDSGDRPSIPEPMLSYSIKRGEVVVDEIREAGSYKVDYTCSERYLGRTFTGTTSWSFVLEEEWDGTAPALTGTAPSKAYVKSGPGFESHAGYRLDCADDGAPGTILFDPPLATLEERPADDPHDVTIYCPDARGNTAGNRTAEIVVDMTPPEPPSPEDDRVDEGGVFRHGQTCAQDEGSPVTPGPELEIRNSTDKQVDEVDTSAPGTFTIRYTCRDAADNRLQGQPQTVTVNPAPGRGADPEITGTGIIHFRQGTAPDPHNLRCDDGGADLTSTITGDKMVNESTPDGNVTVTYTCTDERESKTDTHKITYIVDGTAPVISPATGTVTLELGGTFEPEDPTCTDPYPRATISEINRDGRDAVEAALLSKAESDPTITYDCTDAVGNPAVQSVRTFDIRDTTAPAAPIVSRSTVTVEEGAVLDLGDVTCTQDDGTPVSLRNSTTLDNSPHTGPIDTSTPGTYVATYACHDANQGGDPAVQTVTVNPAPGRGSDPRITGRDVIHFRQWTEPPAHGLACADGSADLTDTITGDTTVDATTGNGNVTVTYTCTDELESKTDTHEITYIVDGTAPVISPPTGTVTLELGDTFEPENPTCTDPYPRAAITGIDRDGRDDVEAALLSKSESEQEITYDCTDAVGNPAVQSVRTFEIRDTTAPAAPTVLRAVVTVAEDAVPDLGDVTCTQDDGTPVSLSNTTTLDNEAYTGPIVTSAPGTYRITYTCHDAKQISEPVIQTVTIDPAPGRGADPEITGTEIIHFRQGTAPDAHGLACSDGPADLTPTITGDVVVDESTQTGNVTVTYTCTDERESKTATHKITYIVDGTAPVISPATGTVTLELGETFSPEEPTCADPYPEAELEVARAGRSAVEDALSSKSESDPEITYDCTDAVGNEAVQSVRTFEIRDTTAPAAPTVSRAVVPVAEDAVPDLGDVMCTQDDGTPISLRNSTTLDNNPHTGPIVTSAPGTYVITYTCHDAKQAGDPATQTVNVSPAPGRGADPEITGRDVIHFKQGTAPEPHGLACADGSADLTGTITEDVVVDESTPDGNVTVTYTCTDTRESKTATHEITYIVDGTAPVISPATGTVTLELGGTFSPEEPTCTDPYPEANLEVARAGHSAVEDALSSKSESDPEITYDCEDAVGNHAVQSIRTFEIRDTMPPAAPTVSRATVTVAEDAVLDLGAVTCAQDDGTPVSLRNSTTLDNSPHDGPVDTSVPGTYVITYTCHDANRGGDPTTQTVTVEAAPGRGADPEITGREVIHFRQGTAPEPHGLMCADGSADLTDTITGDTTVDESTQDGNATVTYTCTDERESKTATHKITYIVDGTAPVISPATGTIQLELGETFEPEMVTCTDPYPRAAITGIDRDGRDDVEAALLSKSESEQEITYDCEDAVGNPAIQSVRTFEIRDTTAPAAPTVSLATVMVDEGAIPDLGDVTCAQDDGTPSSLRNSTTLDNNPHTGPIDTSTPGTYVVTYTCHDANRGGDPATQTVTVDPAPGRGADPEITGVGVIHFRQGTAPEAHGLTCDDGGVDLTSTITGDATVDATTGNGNVTVTYTCTDERESKTDTHEITYIVDGTAPVISPATGTVTLELGGTFSPEEPTCTDPYPEANLEVARAGHSAVEDALSSKSESDPEITYDCEDAVGNPAIQSVRTFEIRDTTAPAAPTVSLATVPVAEGADLDLGAVACAQDGGTPVSLSNTTTLDNNPHDGPIVTSAPGTYVITYTCHDAKQAGEPVIQTVTVNPAPGRGSDPRITGVDVIHFREGTAPDAHGLTCSDGPADLTSTITGDITVDESTPDGNTTVTYTCTDERESKTAIHKITYIVDGTAPVISPATGTVALELGETFEPEVVTCTDPYPRASISDIDRDGRDAVEAALSSKAESEREITYDCEDAVGNPAIQSVRTFEIRDTTAPSAPTVSLPAVTVREGAMPDLGEVTCTQDDGTPSSLQNVTTLNNNPHAGPIDTSRPGTYEITYTCNDAKLASDPATQTVTVDPAPGRDSDPEITGRDVIHFRQGTAPEPHGLTCDDGPADLTSAITADVTVDSATSDGNVTVTYTCTDERESKTAIHKITYIVDGTAPVISPATGTVQLELGETFEPEMVTCTDPYPRAAIAAIDRAGRDTVEDALASKSESDPEITYDCSDAVGNPAVQSVRTFEIRDTTAPAAPTVSLATVPVAEGADLDLGAVACAQDGGTPVSLSNTTTLDNNPHDGPIVTSAPGTYVITYTCNDAKLASDPAMQTVTVNPAPGRGSDPEITGTEVIHFRQGTTPGAHGLTCSDGGVDLTSTITGDITVDSTTPTGNATVTYTCTDEQESKTATHEITYIVDGTAPVISPATGTIQLELGGTFTPEDPTCTDPYPEASISEIDRAGRPAVEAALLSKAESDQEITYDCTDAVGNPAIQSVRTFEIRDTTAPSAPTVSLPAVTVREGAMPDLGDVTCTQDDGTPIVLRNTTALDNSPHAGPIDTSAPGTYEITYTCHDAKQAGDPATQAVTVMTSPNTPPAIVLDYMNNSNVEVGTDPTATCRDAEDGDSPASRTGGDGFDVDDATFGFDLRAKPYTFTYTCTDTGGLTNSTTGMITQVSNIPHLAITAFDYNADGRMTFAALVGSFHRQNNDYTQEDPRCYFHTIGEVQRDTNYVPEINDTVKEAIRDRLGRHDVAHTCTVEGRSNTLVHTVYTVSRDLPAITVRPGPEAVHPLGDIFEHLSTCSSVFGGDLPLEPSIVDVDGTEVGAIDESTPRGKYVITYSCTQTIEETDHHERGTLEAATAMLTVDVTERTKPRLVVPSDRIVHPLGEALDLAAVGATCTDGEGTAELDHDPPITASTPADSIDVTVTCTDESGNYVKRTVEVVITDMETPLITLLGDPVIMSEGHLFRDPGASCTDVQDGRLDVTTETTRYGLDGAAEIGDPGRYEMTYHCTDSDGNKAEPATRTVHVGRVGDSLPPVISINGFSTTMVRTGGAYEDPGAVCSDANYGDLPVVVREEVDAARPGSYYVTYTCTDGTFTSTAKRTVDVVAEVPEDVTPPEILIPGEFSEFAAMDTGSAQGAGSTAAGGATGIIDPAGNATFVPAPGPGGVASSHGDRLPHRQGTEFVPPILWCVDGMNHAGEEIRTASNSSHMITRSTAAGQEEVTYTCKDAAGNTATQVVMRVEVEEEGRPAAASLIGSRTVTMSPGQVYREEGAMCDDGRFNRPDRQLLPVIQPGSDSPAEFSKPGRYEISYACEAAGTMSGIITRIIIVKSGGSGEEDWHLNPTFGLSWLDNTQAVRGGFSFDGTVVDVTDNFHAKFARIDAAVGEEHVITAKAYSERDLERFTIYLGVPDVSRATDAEAEIAIDVTPDSAAESWYSILGTSHEQEDPLVDVDHTRAEIRRVACSPGSDIKCLEVEVAFRVMAPLSSDIMAISAMDTERRVTVTYVNDGVTFTGDSMIPPKTASFTFRAGNQHPAEEVNLVQKDRRYNVWEDQHGFAWLQNQYGSWTQVTHAEFERLADPAVSVVTRHHDSFADLLRAEQERAALVFNATDLQREVGESFSHDAPVRVEKLKDPAILERLHISELAALEYLGRP